jgi:ER membrane protein complex subunit 6
MSTTAELDAQRLYAPNILHNSALANIKFVSTCFAGAAAGVLGLEKWAGVGLFVASTLLTAGFVFSINCGGRPKAYVPGGVLELVNPGQENVMTFLLAWTLFYGACSMTSLPPV